MPLAMLILDLRLPFALKLIFFVLYKYAENDLLVVNCRYSSLLQLHAYATLLTASYCTRIFHLTFSHAAVVDAMSVKITKVLWFLCKGK